MFAANYIVGLGWESAVLIGNRTNGNVFMHRLRMDAHDDGVVIWTQGREFAVSSSIHDLYENRYQVPRP